MIESLPEVVTVATHGYDVLRRDIVEGELIRLRPGAYLPADSLTGEVSEQERTRLLARCVALAEKLTTPFAFGDVTAAALHGWAVPRTALAAAHIVQTTNPCAGGPGDVVRRVCRSWADEEVTSIRDLPVTGVRATIVACARLLPPDDAFVVVNSAFGAVAAMSKFRRAESEARQEFLRSQLLERLSALGPVRGVRVAREVIELADGFAEWAGESRMRWIALAAGLPVPTCQLELWADGRQYFTDAAWRGDGPHGSWLVLAEFDGAVKYQGERGAAALAAEKLREDALRDAHGARFARVDTSTVSQPPLALRRLLDAFPPGCAPQLEPRPLLQVRKPSPRRRDR